MREGIVHVQASLDLQIPLGGVYIGTFEQLECELLIDQDGNLVGVDVPSGKLKLRVDRKSTGPVEIEIRSSAKMWVRSHPERINEALAELDEPEEREYTGREYHPLIRAI